MKYLLAFPFLAAAIFILGYLWLQPLDTIGKASSGIFFGTEIVLFLFIFCSLIFSLYNFSSARLKRLEFSFAVLFFLTAGIIVIGLFSPQVDAYMMGWGPFVFLLLGLSVVAIPILMGLDLIVRMVRRVKNRPIVSPSDLSMGQIKRRWLVAIKLFGSLLALCIIVILGYFVLASKSTSRNGLWYSPPAHTCSRQNLGAAPGDDKIGLMIALKAQSATTTDQYIQSLSDPSSPNYHKWMTPEEYNAPYSKSFQVVHDWLTGRGFSIGDGVSQSLFFSGTASQIQSAFGTTMNKFCVSWGTCYSPSDAPTDGAIIPIPSELVPYIASINNWSCMPPAVPAKPVIYLYPQKPESVTVTLNYAGVLTSVYPSFNDGSAWNVFAYPDGRIVDSDKEYSYLFWEGQDNHMYDMSTGFVVKGSDTAEFLQQQLAKMGLLPKEYNEFIVYWLPKLEHNPYNLIHFAGSDYTSVAKLSIIPTPDSILRVFMVYKPLAESIDVPTQIFPTFVRKGFVVVEWGGTEY